MRGRAALDWLLLATLLPIYLVGVVMSVVYGIRGEFVYPPFLVSSAQDAESPPMVRQVFLPHGEAAGALAVGDALWRLDGADLRGLTMAGFGSRWCAVARSGGRVLLLTVERDGARSDVRVPLIPASLFWWVPWWAPLTLVLGVGVTGVLLLVRVPHWHLTRRTYLTCMLVAFAFTPYFSVPTMPRVALATSVLGIPLIAGTVLRSACELIPEARLWGRWQCALTWVLGLLEAASLAAIFWLPDAGVGAVLMRSMGVPALGFLIAIPVALTLAYRRSDPLGRRQIKWIVYGNYVAILPSVAFFIVSGLVDRPQVIGVLSAVSMMALVASPLGLLVAIAFYHFLDIDRLFGATLSYSVLAILGLAIVLGVMPPAARAAGDVLGITSTSSQAFLSLVLAAVLVPAQRIARPRIDRLLFPERVTLEQGFGQLLAELSGSGDLRDLVVLVQERLDELLRPTSTVVYARDREAFTPMAVRGRPLPPAFATRSALIAALEERAAPLAAERWTARRAPSLTPFERAAIETLDVAVLVPIRRGPDLVAFSCLGPKRSGDIYTSTDIALLGAVAGKISDRLLALDAQALNEQARAMQHALRRYVPGAVAERIVSGREVEAGEREVTVLFVDIRGYTGFAETRRAEEIFHTVNRYTETASRHVQAHGGVVVEFTGDGMMAVFGAPDEIPMKEAAAVQTARDILAAIAALPGPGEGARPALAVGVGIATGPAFVGNVQSVDRSIWTVIGNTTNLAARLQGLTRELDAAVAVDEQTFRRAGQVCADFVRHGDVVIRGRVRRETVHTLPLR